MRHLARTAICVGGGLVLVVSCHNRPQTAATPAPRAIGTFAFRFGTGSSTDDGTFTISRDTVTLDTKSTSCVEDRRQALPAVAYTFHCLGLATVRSMNLRIDLARPERSGWNGVQTVAKEHQVCQRDSLTKTGETVCARYFMDKYDTDVPVGGRLFVTAVKLDSGQTHR
jgi:hypothetical protein